VTTTTLPLDLDVPTVPVPIGGPSAGRAQFVRGAKGRHMPEGAVMCARPWTGQGWHNPHDWRILGRPEAIRRYRADLLADRVKVERARRELRGRVLVCWCALDQDCHADLLLRIAAGEPW
jgi:hypothetical protein